MATKRSNGEGNIRKKNVKGKTYWEGRYTGVDGKQHSVSGKTQSEVRTKLQEKLKDTKLLIDQQLNGNACIISLDMTLNEVFDLYHEVFCGNLKPQTIALEKYNYDLRARDVIGHHAIKNITTITIQKWINDMANSGLSLASIKNASIVISKVFAYMFNEGIMQRNPFKGVKYYGNPPRKKRALTDEEVITFYNTAQEMMPQMCPVICLLYNTGVRIGELMAVTWNDISDDGLYMSINKTKIKYKDDKTQKYVQRISTPKTEESNRIVPLTTEARQCIKQLREDQELIFSDNWDDNRTILLNKWHRAYGYSSILGMFRQINHAIQEQDRDFINVTPHSFRHTFASNAIKNKIPEIYIQHLCGWSNLTMLHKVYGHVTPKQLLDAISMNETSSVTVQENAE